MGALRCGFARGVSHSSGTSPCSVASPGLSGDATVSFLLLEGLEFLMNECVEMEHDGSYSTLCHIMLAEPSQPALFCDIA